MATYFSGWGTNFIGWGGTAPTPVHGDTHDGAWRQVEEPKKTPQRRVLDDIKAAYAKVVEREPVQAAQLVRPFAKVLPSAPMRPTIDWAQLQADTAAVEALIALYEHELLLEDDEEVAML